MDSVQRSNLEGLLALGPLGHGNLLCMIFTVERLAKCGRVFQICFVGAESKLPGVKSWGG